MSLVRLLPICAPVCSHRRLAEEDANPSFKADSTRPSSLALLLVVSSPWPLQRVFWRLSVPSSILVPLPAVGKVRVCASPRPLRRSHCLSNGVLLVTISFAWAPLLVARAPSPRIFVCTLSTKRCFTSGPSVRLGQHILGCRLVVHHVEVPVEPARKSDLRLVEAALDVLFPDFLKPSLTSSSRACQYSLVRWLVGHLIDVGFGHMPSICFPPQAPGGGVPRTVTELFSLLWSFHCVDVSLLFLCSCHRDGCHARGWHVVHEAARLTTIYFPAVFVSALVEAACLVVLWYVCTANLAPLLVHFSGCVCVHSNVMTSWWVCGPCHFLPFLC